MTMSIGGLISGLDTTSLITQLLRAEALPQTALKTRMSIASTRAEAYRSVNTRFDALRTAAEAMLQPETWTAVKATSSATSVAATATAGAPTGSLTFDVVNTAATHSVVSGTTWTATTDAYGMTSPIEVRAADGTVKGTITVGGNGTLDDAVRAINDSEFGLSATAVKLADGQYRLQVTAETSGAAASFDLGDASTFAVATQGVDARLTVGSGPGAYDVTSSTNTFADLMSGVTITVSKPETAVTVDVAADPAAVATKMQALVDAANRALSEIEAATASDGGRLKGDSALRALTGRVLEAVSFAVGSDGSTATIGLELDKDGTFTFDAATFSAALAEDPALARRLGAGGPTGPGPDGTSGTDDDVVPGVAQRLLDVAKSASDTTTGTLTLLAQGSDDLAEDIQDRIEAWDVRLVMRKAALTRQFTAMETALGGLQNQSSWLAGQLNSLPSWS